MKKRTQNGYVKTRTQKGRDKAAASSKSMLHRTVCSAVAIVMLLGVLQTGVFAFGAVAQTSNDIIESMSQNTPDPEKQDEILSSLQSDPPPEPTEQTVTGESTSKETETAQEYTVTLFVGENQYLEPISTVDGKITEPQAPAEDAYPEGAGAFTGWFFEQEGGGKFSADTQITADTKLYAQFETPAVTGIPPQTPAPQTPVPEGPAPLAEDALTVTLVVNGQPYGDIILVDNGKISMPLPPSSDVWPANSSFAGWYTQQEGGALFDPETEIVQSISLYARFNAENFLVTFEDQYGKTFDTLDATPGQPYPQTGKLITPDEGKRFLYWVEKGTDVQFDFNAPAAKDVTLVPYFSNSYYVFFFSEGTQIDPVAVDAGSKVTAPAAPSRNGYQFTGWATEDGQAYNFDQPVNDTLRLYAQWQGQEVGYTVVYWTERANIVGTPSWPNDYISVKVGGGRTIAGTQITTAGEVDLSGKPDDAKLKYFDVSAPRLGAPVTIQGNGQSVVNVCYDRIVYTMDFVLSEGRESVNGTLTWAGAVGGQGTYTNPTKDQVVYSFDAKYEQDISNLWPSMNVNMTLANNGAKQPYGWQSYTSRQAGGGGETMVTKRMTLEPDLIPKTGDPDTWTGGAIATTVVWFPMYSEQLQKYELNYWFQALSDETGVPAEADGIESMTSTSLNGRLYVKDQELSQVVESAKYNLGKLNGFSAKSLEGMNTAGWTKNDYAWANVDENDVVHYNFYYNRKLLNIKYDSFGGSYIPQKNNVMFGEKISHLKPADPTKTNAKFLGWYYDSEYKNPVNWETDTVKTSQTETGGVLDPGTTVTLFAKWESQENTVFFYDKQTSLAGGKYFAAQGVETGRYVDFSRPIEMDVNGKAYSLIEGQEVPGYGEFLGWYWLIDNREPSKFSEDTPVNRDYSLYANWKTTGFKLTYDKGAATDGTLPTADGVYDIGTQVRVAQNTGNLVSGNLVFIGWLSDMDGKLYYENSKIAIQGNTVLTAQFGDPTAYSQITFAPGYSGSGQANVIAKAERNKETKLAAADTFTREGYDFVGWQLTGGGTYAAEAAYTPTAVTATFTALWKAQAHTVTFITDGNGTLTGETTFAEIPDGTAWAASGVKAPTPVANPGYYFYGWTPAIPNGTAQILTDETYVATFKAQQEIKVTAASADKTYDGTPLTKADVTDYTKSQLKLGDTIQVTMTAESTITNAGTRLNVIETFKIMRDGVDVTNEYKFATPTAGELKINKMKVTLTVTDKDKTYGESDPAYDYKTDVTPGADFTVSFSRTPDDEDVKTDGTKYEIKATVSNPNYDVTVVPGELKINPREITLTANSGAKSHGTADPDVIYADPKLTKGSFAPGEGVDKVFDQITRVPGENVGSYAVNIKLKANPNYKVNTNAGNLEITKSTVKVSITPVANSKVYDGQGTETDPQLSATVNGLPEGTLEPGRDYTLTREEGSDVRAGGYPISVELIGDAAKNYADAFLGTGTFTINPRPVELTANSGSKTYGQTDAEALPADWKGAKITDGDLIGNDTLNYSVSRTGSENAGTHAVIVTLGNNPNYEVKPINGTFVIYKKTIDVKANNAEKIYGQPDPAFSATATGLVGADKLDYTFTREGKGTADGENVGQYAISVNPGEYENYIINPVPGGQLTIKQKDVTVTAKPNGKVYGYDDPVFGAEDAIVDGTLTGESLVYSTDYTLKRVDGEDVNDYAINVVVGENANKNYKIVPVEGKFTITPRPITLKADDKTKKFDEKDPPWTATVQQEDPDGVLTKDLEAFHASYTLDRAEGSTAGRQYNINVHLGATPNYKVTPQTGTLTIVPANVDVTIRPLGGFKTYGEDDPSDALEVEIVGLPKGETLTEGKDYTVTRAEGDTVGSYNIYVEITPPESENYDYKIDWVRDVKFEVKPRPITITADDKRKTYGTKEDPEFSAQLTDGTTMAFNETIADLNLGFEREDANNNNAGFYDIDASVKKDIFGQNAVAKNYEITFKPGTLTIDPRDITIQVNDASKAYGDDDPTFSLPDPEQLVPGDEIALTFTREPGEVVRDGGYEISGKETVENPNYKVEVLPGTLTIVPREVTVKANDAGKVYGETDDPKLGVTITNMPADEEKYDKLMEGKDYTITRDPGREAKDYYAIKVGVPADSNPNYKITPEEGKFIIAKRDVTMQINSTGKEFGVVIDPPLSAEEKKSTDKKTGLIAGEKLEYTLIRTPGEDATTYPITAKYDKDADANKNYNITFLDGIFTITPKGSVKIIPEEKTITYGGEEKKLTATVIGAKAGELDFTLERTDPTNVNAGTYTISVKLGDNPNYTIDATATAPYVIEQVDATIKADAKNLTYGETPAEEQELTAQTSGMVKNEELSYTLKCSEEITSTTDAGTYPITVEFDPNAGANRNYKITTGGANFVVAQRPATIKVEGPSEKVYGDPDQEFTYTELNTVNNDKLSYKPTREQGEKVKPDGEGGYLPYEFSAEFDAAAGANKNYKITVKPAYMTITPRAITVTPDDTGKEYDGKGKETDPSLNVTIGNSPTNPAFVPTPGEDFTVSREDGKDVKYDENGKVTYYPITVTQGSNPNFVITPVEGKFTITQKDVTIKVNDGGKPYQGPEPDLRKYATVGKTVNNEELAFDVVRDSGETVTQEGYRMWAKLDPMYGVNKNYKIHTEDGTFYITASGTVTIYPKVVEVTYGDPERKLTKDDADVVGAKQDEIDFVLERNPGDDVKYDADGNVISYEISARLLSVNGNYETIDTSHKGGYTITPRDASVEALKNDKIYGEADPELKAKETGAVKNETLNYTLAREGAGTPEGQNVKAGGYPISVTLGNNPNYTVTQTGATFTIKQRPAEIRAKEQTITYGQTPAALDADVTGVVKNETLNYSLSTDSDGNAGRHNIIVVVEKDENPNYDVTAIDAPLIINKKQITVTPDNGGKTYGDPEPPILTGKVDGAVEGGSTPKFDIVRRPGENAGNYTITVVTGNDPNYDIVPGEGTFTIAKKDAVLRIDNKGKVYGDADPALTAKAEKLIAGDTLNYTLGRTGGEDAGDYPITATLGENKNYNVEVINGNLAIAQRDVNVIITPNNATKVYGAAEAPLTAQVSGTVNGDGLNYTLSRDPGEGVGSYAINVDLGSNPNYKVAVGKGAYTITPATATITVGSYTKTAGAGDPGFAATVTGLVNGETLAYTLNREAGEAVGSYAINAQLNAENPNYNVVVVPGALTITAAAAPAAPAAAAPAAPAAPAEQVVTIGGTQTPQGGNNPEAIGDPKIPLASVEASWALLNLILAIVTGLISLMLVITYFVKKRRDDEEEDEAKGVVMTRAEAKAEKEDEETHVKRKGLGRILSLVVTVIAVVVFILTENMSLPVVWTDEWTLLMGIIAIVNVVLAFLCRKEKKDNDEQQNKQLPDDAQPQNL